MIKTTLGGLVNAEAPLNKLAQATLPIKAAYQVKKLAQALAVEIKLFHEQRQQMIQDLGETRDQTEAEQALSGNTDQVLAVTPGNHGEFLKRMMELAAIEVELPTKPLDLSTIGEYAISAVDLALLEAVTVMPED